jgi:hypothetical protein
MTPEQMHILIEAERVILDPEATEEQKHKAISEVDQLGDKDASEAIRRTRQHEEGNGER